MVGEGSDVAVSCSATVMGTVAVADISGEALRLQPVEYKTSTLSARIAWMLLQCL